MTSEAKAGEAGTAVGGCPYCACAHRYHGQLFLNHPRVLRPGICPACRHQLIGKGD